MSLVRSDTSDVELARIWSRLSADQQSTFLALARWFEHSYRCLPKRRTRAHRYERAKCEAALPVECLLRSAASQDWADVTASCKVPRDEFQQALADLREEVRQSVSTLNTYQAIDKRIANVTAAGERYKKCYAVAAYRVGRHAVRAVLQRAYRKNRAAVERALEVLWPYLTAHPELAARVLVRAGWFDAAHASGKAVRGRQARGTRRALQTGRLIRFPAGVELNGVTEHTDPD